MGPNPAVSNTTVRTGPDKLALAISCLRQGRNAEAFLILCEPGFEKEPAAQFALGLCYLRAEETARAVTCFEQALRFLKTASVPAGDSAGNDVYIRLAVKQIASEAYLEPMDAEVYSVLPRTAKNTILMALVHAYKKNGMPEQARKIAAGLTGTEFEELRRTL